jgi:peptide/nickel transport system permease protein
VNLATTRRRFRIVSIGSAAMFVSLLVGFVGVYSMISGQHPGAQLLEDRLISFSGAHLMGTDQLGRDLLSRVGAGTRNSLATGLILFLVAGVGGGLIGIVSGYSGGKTDFVVQRAVDTVMSLPLIVLVLAVVASTGGSFFWLTMAMSVAFLPLSIRVARSSVLSLRSADFVLVARSSGASPLRICVKHIIPNTVGPWVIVVTSQVSAAILVESALAFLGAAPGRLTLGALLAGDAQTYMSSAPWLLVWPGLMLALLALAINLAGEWVAVRSMRLPGEVRT